MIKKIDHIVITTNDIEKCINFYSCLGFSPKDAGSRYELFAGDFKINVHIKNHELSPHAQYVQTGSADICLELAGDIEDFKMEILKKGIEIEIDLVNRTGVKGKMRSIYLRDPDGNLVEFSSYE